MHNIKTLDEFRDHPGDPLSYANINAYATKPENEWLVSLVGFDIDEEIDGYTKEELNEIILYLEYIKSRLDIIEDSEKTPGLFDGGDKDGTEETNTRGMG